MTKWLLWRRGLIGTSISVSHLQTLDGYDRDRKIGTRVQLPPEHEELSLVKLAKLYPPPKGDISEASTMVKLQSGDVQKLS